MITTRVLGALGLFLVAYAVLTLLKPRSGKGNKQDSLGCGFVLLAGGVWGVALGRYLNDTSAGIRLGMAGALILPALASLLQRRTRGVVMAAVSLAAAILLAAPEFPKLQHRLAPTESTSTVEDLEQTQVSLSSQIQKTSDYLETLANDRKQISKEIDALDYPDFDALAKDPRGYALLKELADIDRFSAQAREQLDTMSRTQVRIETALRRLRRLAQAEQVTGADISEAEIAQIMREANQVPTAPLPATVEAHAQKEELRQLFEQEFNQ
jgi:hypothetical protein